MVAVAGQTPTVGWRVFCFGLQVVVAMRRDFPFHFRMACVGPSQASFAPSLVADVQ
jgi:hypothetical protein